MPSNDVQKNLLVTSDLLKECKMTLTIMLHEIGWTMQALGNG